jgi:hypothetical protein
MKRPDKLKDMKLSKKLKAMKLSEKLEYMNRQHVAIAKTAYLPDTILLEVGIFLAVAQVLRSVADIARELEARMDELSEADIARELEARMDELSEQEDA